MKYSGNLRVSQNIKHVFKTTCEQLKCQYYVGQKCTDPVDWVNQYGESVCGRREDAIHPDDYKRRQD